MKNNKILWALIISLNQALLVNAGGIEDGKSIFLTRCAACHNVNRVMTGPALAGVSDRRGIDWIIHFVHSSQTLVKKGDSTALSMFEKFNRVPMPDHPDLTTENIKSILAYIKSESKPAGDQKGPFAKPGTRRTLYQPLRLQDAGLWAGYLLTVIALIASLYYGVMMKRFQLARKPIDQEPS